MSGLLTAGLLPAFLDSSAWAVPRPSPGASHTAAVHESQGPAPTEDAALEQARRTGREVEVGSLRGESADVVATAEGKLQARQYLRPVRTRVSGQWKDIDTDLAEQSNGTVAPKAAAVGLAFSGGGDKPLVTMRKAGRELALSWPGALPAPVLDGAQATYREVLPGVDLRMGAQADGFTQLLIVKSAQAASSSALGQLRLKLAADGVDVKETAAGGLNAVDRGAGSPVFEAPTPLMWDSSTGPGSSASQKTPKSRKASGKGSRKASLSGAAPDGTGSEEPSAGESGKLAPVGVDVPAGQDQVVLKPDAGVLKGKDTVYPVFIDPQWSTPRAASWTMASKYWASSPQWKFNGDHDAGMGYCNWNYCQPNDTKRLFYQVPTSAFAGKSILSAEFVVRNTWSASCSEREVELWRTKAISSSTTWNSQNESGFWQKHLASDSFAYGYEGCAAKDGEFNVRSAVQEAADGAWPTLTFGLKAGSESDGYAWKRFSDKAYLRVTYNRPPPQVKPSQLVMEYGGTCKKSSAPARIRTRGKLYAYNITDPDRDNVRVQFQASWDAGDGKGSIARWTPGLTTAKQSGSRFVISLPSTIPSNKTVGWAVRTYDGAQYSPWSFAGSAEACYFVHDSQQPAAPTIGSRDYPASDPEDPDDPWYDGVGQYGSFTVADTHRDVNRYVYGINSDPSAKNTATTTGGAARNITLLPEKPGLNFVTVQAFDTAGNNSEIRTYFFRVKAGQPERAIWQFDDSAGAAEARGSAPARTADLHGGATTGAEGVTGTALSLNGTDGYAATDIPVVDTSRGFSVSAWVRPREIPDHPAIIATQPGNYRPGFELYYSADLKRWVFNQYTADSPDAGIARAMADRPGGITANSWTHLVGVYDSTAKALQLYVDGKLAGQTPYATAWSARRGLQLGAGSYDGNSGAFFPGSLDEVQIFDRPVSAAEVTRLYAKERLRGPGRPARAVFPLDEPADAKQVTGHGDVMPAVFHGGAEPGRTGVAGNALTLDGKDDYASVDTAHFNTERSYTLTAWARVTDATRNQTIAAQNGSFLSAFYLSYEATGGVWSIRLATKDANDGGLTQQRVASKQKASIGKWAHLAAVHDTVDNTVSLYVNGILQGSAPAPQAWYADGALQIGRALYRGAYTDHLVGQIDDMRVFDRPVSEGEIHQLVQRRPVLTGRWQFDQATNPGDNSVVGGPAMTLGGGAKQVPGAGFMGGGLMLDGVRDYASGATPLDTSTSFTVTAWAQAASMPSRPAALVSAEAANTSGFAMGFAPNPKKTGDGLWEVVTARTDTAETEYDWAGNAQPMNSVTDWNHLALVYDGFARQLRVYVNGELGEAACLDADGDGQADDEKCTEVVPWAEDVISLEALKSLQIGRAKGRGAFRDYWPGAIDDVWTFQGALTDEQIGRLAGEWFELPTEVPDVPDAG
ncbi:LamG-like jellyroll fold domain-containing protein [Streptomyces sp. DSM 41527]|uniref:LamG-like jellyroll fold domain-containing protein n=1 Tax=Streptomyces mooreae TaxID=3075523 RepID=A0ABU2TI92_9ACTN|nr:LamG-like jellyroll fold domain-containing protein [Streptomyces sp. DSM 41527]MDT0460668.1 LamG-like jellyroll fold domain-containing protein [Streptomyces sp. DSM 41527]